MLPGSVGLPQTLGFGYLSVEGRGGAVAQRYCTNCGNELSDDARFCGSCGRPTHRTAAVATPEADVDVPPLPTSIESISAPTADTSVVGSSTSTFIALGITVLVFVVVGMLVSGNGGGALMVAILGILVVVGLTRTYGGDVGKDGTGRLVLREGATHPVPQAERSRILDEEVGQYMRDGFFVRHRTQTAAQLVKPKKFSFVWALLWFLVFGVGIVGYLVYYAAKRDEGRYVDEYGTVKATRQVHHVL